VSQCVAVAMQPVVLREEYPDGLRDTLACGHVIYSTYLDYPDQRLCLLCLRSRKPRESTF